MTDMQQISPPEIPQYFFQLQDTFSKEMNLVSGINEELMGSAMDDKAGILSACVKGLALQPCSQYLIGWISLRICLVSYA